MRSERQYYYTFDAPINSRSFNSDITRHGYQGSEKDNDIGSSGRHITTYYREGDFVVIRSKNTCLYLLHFLKPPFSSI